LKKDKKKKRRSKRKSKADRKSTTLYIYFILMISFSQYFDKLSDGFQCENQYLLKLGASLLIYTSEQNNYCGDNAFRNPSNNLTVAA